LVCVVSAG